MWDAVNGGLEPQSWQYNVIWALPYPNIRKFGPHLQKYNSVRVHPYAHPHHMKVLKHFIYIQYGCGMQSVGAYSLNNDPTNFLKFCPHPAQIKRCKGAPICPSTAHEHEGAQKTCNISNMDVGSSQQGLRASTMSMCHHFIATLTPKYQNLGQELCQCNCVRVHPYAYPQHTKVLWIGSHTSNMNVGSSQ